ncbi:PREDICTED: F-box only protein 32 isoform X3 [Nanorana parkeri]|uniref:F-box only protein 32 isoform X3 n=1 Tax=Nanorana parkeri TaxID=125878 RepID=UPI0008543A4F|nr:PREDICTED: F-box only protein 32 isoform X3 [Nanorana parkeri]
MPFLGQDWRSPGQSWVKTEDGWKRFLDQHSNYVSDINSYFNVENNKENLYNNLNYDISAKKRKKDLLNNNTKTQYFYQEKWIYVHKGSTKERHGYCTLGEAFNRLDFSTAILDSRKFNYVVRPAVKGTTLTDLPLCLQMNIIQRLTDGRDIVCLGQVSLDLQVLSEDRLLWKKLCHYHFTERQIRKRLIISDNGTLDWKKMYFKLVRCYPRREQYGDTLQFCQHCHILSWKGTEHPCTANNPESCLVSLSPQDFINLFRF